MDNVAFSSLFLHCYTSKSCSTCGTIGNRQRHDFNCPQGHYDNSGLNAAHNLAQWDGNSCSLELQRVASVVDSTAIKNGLFGTVQSRNTLRQPEMGSDNLMNTQRSCTAEG